MRLDVEAFGYADEHFQTWVFLCPLNSPQIAHIYPDCGSACKKDPASGVIGVQKGTTIPMV